MAISCSENVEIITWSSEFISNLNERYLREIKTGGEIHMESSIFQGYMAEISTLDDVDIPFKVMKLQHPEARHIVCTYRLPGRNSVKFQDGVDDGEHGPVGYILQALKDAEIFHRVLFVTHKYKGEHIGHKRFEGYLWAARSAILHMPLLPNLNVSHKPWSEEECKIFTGRDYVKRRIQGCDK